MASSPEQRRLIEKITEMILRDFSGVNEHTLGEVFTEVLKELRVRGGTGMKAAPDDAERPPASPRARQISRRRDERLPEEDEVRVEARRSEAVTAPDLPPIESGQALHGEAPDFRVQLLEGELLSRPSGPFHERDQVIHQRVDDGEHVLGLEMFSDRALRTIHAQLTDTGGIFLPLHEPIPLNSVVDVCVMLPVIRRETWFQGRIVACAAAGTAIDIQPFDDLYRGHWEQAIILMCEGRADHLRPTEGGPVTVSPRRDKTSLSVSYVTPRPQTLTAPQTPSSRGAATLDDSTSSPQPHEEPAVKAAQGSHDAPARSSEFDARRQGSSPSIQTEASQHSAHDLHTDAPSCDAPSHDAPSHDVPSHDAPSYDAPSYDAPSHDAPSHDAVSLDAVSLDAVSLDAVSLDAPSYDVGSLDTESLDAVARHVPHPGPPGYPGYPVYGVPPQMHPPGAPPHWAGAMPVQMPHGVSPGVVNAAMPHPGQPLMWGPTPPHQGLAQNPAQIGSMTPLTAAQAEDIAQKAPLAISHDFPATSLNSTLVEISTQNSDGLLSIKTPQMVYHVVVQMGSPVDVLTVPDNPDLHLGALLVQAKRIEWEQHKNAERLCAEQNMLYSDALTELRLMPYHQVLAAMESRMRYTFRRLFEIPTGTLEWRPLERLPYRYTTPPLRLPAMALNAELRTSAALPKSILEAFHDSHAEDLPKRAEPPPCALAELSLNPKQKRFLKTVLDTAQSMHALMAMSNLNRSSTLALLHALEKLGFITFEARNIQQDYHKRLIDQVQRHAAGLRRLNHFEILEVHWSAYTEMVHKAYRERRRQYSLDAFPDEIHETIKPTCQKILAAIDEAFKVLKNPEKRRAYRTERVSDVQVQNVINVDLKRGDIQLMRSETLEAYECYNRVLELDPRHPQARAKLAAMKRKMGKKPPLK